MEVIDEIGETDLHLGPNRADGADEQPNPSLLIGEGALYAARISDFPAVARRVEVGISRLGGFLWWTFETKPWRCMWLSFAADR